MTLRDLGDALGEHLDLPFHGKTYTVPPMPAKLWIESQAFMSLQADEGVTLRLASLTEQELYAEVLSQPVLDSMIEDGLTAAHIRHAALYVLFYNTLGPDIAQQHWDNPPGKVTSLSSLRLPRRLRRATR